MLTDTDLQGKKEEREAEAQCHTTGYDNSADKKLKFENLLNGLKALLLLNNIFKTKC